MVAVPVITSNGADLPDFGLVSVEVVREVNRVPYARLLFADGDVPAGRFPALDSDALAPGTEIAIAVREAGAVTRLFQGQVLRLGFETLQGVPRVSVECKDKAFRLTRPRRTAVFAQSSDADAIGTILRQAGLTAADLGPDGGVHEALVQYDATDWDFIAARAEANGLAVVVTDGAVAMKPLAAQGPPALKLQLGIDEIAELELELDAGDQHPDIETLGWDLAAAAATEPAAAAALASVQGNIDPAKAGRSLGLGDVKLSHLVPATGGALRAWASARLARQRLSMIRGRIGLAGTGKVAPMHTVELAGMGARFNGTALVSGVRHVLEHGVWRTDLRLGLPPAGVPSAPDILGVPAQGLLPAARGLRIGLVGAYEEDSSGGYRVRVVLPDAGAPDTLWARLASPAAGPGRGFVFRPEVGDEVVVGFLAEDPREPVVLGALFGAKHAPPAPFAATSENNLAKGLATANGIALAFTDQKKPVVTLKTPAGAITIDDEKGELRLTDGHNNSVVLSADGIAIVSAKNLTLEAKGKVTVTGASVDVN
ncbi:MAG TPA: type VI secretion system tip protein VgrG [Xanthobacteraceae bacterium]|nr:type VI secretion system tip protein VgrG [Xanthobacteraceae bacterium]